MGPHTHVPIEARSGDAGPGRRADRFPLRDCRDRGAEHQVGQRCRGSRTCRTCARRCCQISRPRSRRACRRCRPTPWTAVFAPKGTPAAGCRQARRGDARRDERSRPARAARQPCRHAGRAGAALGGLSRRFREVGVREVGRSDPRAAVRSRRNRSLPAAADIRQLEPLYKTRARPLPGFWRWRTHDRQHAIERRPGRAPAAAAVPLLASRHRAKWT